MRGSIVEVVMTVIRAVEWAADMEAVVAVVPAEEWAVDTEVADGNTAF